MRCERSDRSPVLPDLPFRDQVRVLAGVMPVAEAYDAVAAARQRRLAGGKSGLQTSRPKTGPRRRSWPGSCGTHATLCESAQ